MLKKMPDAEYRAIDAVSQSDLSLFSQLTPREYFYRKLTGFTETPAMLLGTLVHAMVLEPETLDDHFAVFDWKDSKRTKVYRDAKLAFETEAQGKRIIDTDLWDEAKSIADHLKTDRNSQLLFSQKLLKEHVILGHKFDGFDVKGKLDAIDLEKRLVIDLKTTTQAFDDQSFQRYAASKGFLIQSAFYMDLARMEFGQDFTFVFCCVQTKSPYLTRKIIVNPNASPDYVTEGRCLYEDALHGLSNCKKNDNWPGYEGQNYIAQLPRWYKG